MSLYLTFPPYFSEAGLLTESGAHQSAGLANMYTLKTLKMSVF